MSSSIVPTDSLYNDITFNGQVSFSKSPNLPAGGLTNADISGTAAIAATKLLTVQRAGSEVYSETSTITSTTFGSFITPTAGGLIDVYGVVTGTVASSTTCTVSVDLQRSTAGGAFATVMTTPVQLVNATIRVPVAGVISNTTVAAGDVWKIVVTAAGSTTNQAKGLLYNVRWYGSY